MVKRYNQFCLFTFLIILLIISKICNNLFYKKFLDLYNKTLISILFLELFFCDFKIGNQLNFFFNNFYRIKG